MRRLRPRVPIRLLPALSLFVLMLFVPTAYKPLKYVLIAVALAMIAVQIVRTRTLSLHPAVLAWAAVFAVAGAIFVINGLILEAPGALAMAPLYVAWPIAYTALVVGAARYEVLQGLRGVVVFAAFAIPMYALLIILTAADFLPSFLAIGLQVEPIVGFYPGYTQIHLTTLPTLLYLVPYLLAAAVTSPKTETGRWRWWLWLALALNVAVSLLSLRRGIILAIGLAPLFIAFLLWFLPGQGGRETRKRLGIAAAALVGSLLVAGVVAFLAFGWTPANMIAMFQAGFNVSDSATDPGARLRALQFGDLLDGWRAHPILGAGAGAYVPSLVRDLEMPWAYELSYMSLLFQTGIVGVALYAAGTAWILWMAIRMIASGDRLGLEILPAVTGAGSFLVANATNPYLAKWDYLWVIFLPVAFINLWLLEGRRRSSADPALQRGLRETQPALG